MSGVPRRTSRGKKGTDGYYKRTYVEEKNRSYWGSDSGNHWGASIRFVAGGATW